ncbi:insulinase family protein [Psychrobacter sp. FDAARGOS_221]|uniref:insulinase family protein n=1 Tax=Psychrobacter sp. FDAARGOS_221 TaxID=1975705 RepID=UPI000BB5985B|nr:insulinase family protein [Psychrobacter sp. FDAARGOS_221]PNK61922.1 peptidase M16 [Psychrobacter sp. FDAARGOS_221]
MTINESVTTSDSAKPSTNSANNTATNNDLDLTLHPSFKLLEHRQIEALSLDVLICQHVDTGAMHYHLAHPSDENAFLVGFRTQPMDSKGEAHILEHTALCGSAKYPVRDPFFSMIKRSLNTFMNAMTAADWTAYPFATQNKNDYFNLLSIYLDAAFFPNLHPLDFAQEGIRVELDEQDKPQFKGIVFNEMKGAMSGEIDQLYHSVASHLFPTTTYHYNSGGDPADIPDLTHQELVDFHQSHYHPSNSVIMSFGNIPVAETQAKLHQDALTQFEAGKKHESRREQRLSAPIQVTETYSVDSAGKQQTHHAMAWLLPTITDPKQRLALRLLEGVLIEHAGSPLRAYLDSHPLATGPSPLLGLDDSHYEMVFYAGVRGSEAEHADAIEQGILDLLQQVADSEIDPDAIETILHQIEIDQRHIGGDSIPYGLNLMLEGFSTAIHDGNPIDIWQVDEHLNWLREQVKDPNWLPNLLKQHLLDNPHRVRVTLVPDENKSAELAAAEQARLDAIEAKLTDEDKAQLKQQAADLTARQAAEDDLSLLPKVGLEDVPESVSFTHGEQLPIKLVGEDSVLHQYLAGTNGLYYYQLLMPLEGQDELINHPLLPLYLGLLSELGTDSLSAREFQAVQAAHSSGVTARVSQRTSIHHPNKLTSYFVVATRALNRKPEAIDLVKQVLEHSVFSEHDRIKELLQQRRAGWQSRLANAGHAYAMQTASRQMSRQAELEYVRSGLPALNALKDFLQQADDDSSQWDELAQALMTLHKRLASLPKQAVLVCEPDQAERLQGLIEQSWEQSLYTGQVEHDNEQLTAHIPSQYNQLSQQLTLSTNISDKSEQQSDSASEADNKEAAQAADLAWLVATNVYHNAAVYPAVTADHPDCAPLMVLAPYLRNGYLHSAIRERGGAYGGGAGYDANACAFKFFSYRDPHCAETFEHFAASIDWLLTQPQQPEQLEEAILGIVSGMDKPGSPAGEAVKSCFAELHQRGEAWQQKMRGNILAVTLEDLQRVARTYLQDKPHTKAVLAPYDKEAVVTELGFSVDKVAS